MRYLKNRHLISVSLSVSLWALIVMGCQQAPDTEVQAARTAIAAAKKVGAETNSSQELVKATSLLDSALIEIEQQNKSFLSRDYAHAKQLLQASAENAQIAGMQSMVPDPATHDSIGAAVQMSEPGKDTVAVSPAPVGPSKDSAESLINQTYAHYQKESANKNSSPAKVASLAEAMSLLKAAKAALKKSDFHQAMLIAEKADSLLTIK